MTSVVAKILSTLNLKGGVGKTTISVNYAAYCGRKGRRVLLCDLDPQTNATFAMIGVDGWEEHKKTRGTIADLLGARSHKSADGSTKSLSDVIIRDAWKNVDLVPSHLDLFTIDLDMASRTAREFQLKKALKDSANDYDIVICDCPPNLTLPTQNALAISTHFVVPVSLDYLSVLGIGLLLGRIEELAGDLQVDLENAGVIISRVGRPARHREQTETVVRSQFPDITLEGMVRDRVAVSQSAENKQSIFQSGDAQAIAEFNSVFSELDSNMGC
jgi:chromosome partitioning protein